MILRGSIKGIDSGGGFTRVDLVALVFVLCLGVVVANPLFTSHSRARSDTLVCQANLGEIGRAYLIWGTDHDDWPPFLVPQEEGGLRLHPLSVNPYIQFAWISNGLSSPKVLVCPADTNTTRRARDFSTNPDGGFMHPAYRNNAVSYMVSFHAQRYLPGSILNADRNIDNTPSAGCAYAPFPLRAVLTTQSSGSQWSQEIHGTKGNLLFTDGSVEETSTAQLRSALIADDDYVGGGGVIHVLFPK